MATFGDPHSRIVLVGIDRITPEQYVTSPSHRTLADRLVAAAGLPLEDVALAERVEADAWELTVLEREAAGRFFLRDGAIASRTVTVHLPGDA